MSDSFNSDDPKALILPAILEKCFDELPAHVAAEGQARIQRGEVVWGIMARSEEAFTVFSWASLDLLRVKPDGWWERATYDLGSFTARWPFDSPAFGPPAEAGASGLCSGRSIVGMPAIGWPGMGWGACEHDARELRDWLAARTA